MRIVTRLVLVALAFSLIITGCGDDDDSASDDDGAPDDDADDDTTDDDTTDDDAADDDTDDDADDDSDDDAVDWSLEPLAVLDCETLFTQPEEAIAFDGSASTSPDGGPLAYELDFDDGEMIADSEADHAFAEPGAYRVTLTVTNDSGFSDRSSCLVQVGGFPTGVGDLDILDFRPNFFNPEIDEPGAPPMGGGVVYAFFASEDSETADGVWIDGVEGHPDSSHVEWCDVLNSSVMAEDVVAVQCHSYDDAFSAGQPLDIAVKAGATTLWSRDENIPAPSLSPTLITANVAGDEMLVYVRNDGDAATALTGLAVDGRDVSDFVSIEDDVLEPKAMGLIRVPRRDGIDYGVFHVFTVFGSTGKSELSGSRVHRVFPPVFPLGNWDSGSDDIYNNMENLEEQLDYGVDMHIYSPSGSNPPNAVVPLAENMGFYLFTHQGGTNPDYEQYIQDYGDSPSVLANAVYGEPDLGNPAIEVLPEIKLQRDLWGTRKPQWGYNACAHRWPAYQPLPDIGGMDHYCVFAPKCNQNWPPFYWDNLWFLGHYAEAAKINSEPKPVWDWTQANAWGDLYFFNRCLTDEEIRAQWYVLVGRGTKGLLWFQFKRSNNETCPGPLPEMKRLAHELDQAKPYLLEGEWYPEGRYVATADSTVDAQVVVGPRGAAIVLTNFHYKLNLIAPWIWHEKINVEVEFTPPAGFEPAAFRLVADEELIDLEWEKIDEGQWRFTLPSLTVSEMILVTPEP